MSEEMKYTFGVPTEPLPEDFLEDLRRQFAFLGFVSRAAYVLLTLNEEISYLMLLDLDLPPEQEQEAVRLVAQSIKFNAKVQYNGKYSLDFGLWDAEILTPILSQDPSWNFYNHEAKTAE